MEIEVLHSHHGDKKANFDTQTAEGRANAAKFFKGMLREGTAVFLERGKKTYRVTGFDAKKNRLLVRVEQKGKESVAATTDKGRKTAIPPRAGG